jgi:CRP/FNR family transcriptional regulator, cyclic AMP receptor protein
LPRLKARGFPADPSLMSQQQHPHFLWADIFRRRKQEAGTVIEALQENNLFRTLTARELRYLANFVYERSYEADEPIFRQNDRGFGMYMVVRGSVAIKTQNASYGETLVTTLGKGSFFGELSLIEQDNIRSASVVAQEKTLLVGFFKPDLMEILERKPEMGVKILHQLSIVLGRRLVETTERMSQIGKSHVADKEVA